MGILSELWTSDREIPRVHCTVKSSLWSDCKNICLPTGIRRPPGSCWKSTPHESELSATDDGIYYMAWSLWRGTWIYSPWASLLVAGSWHCNSWCCARKPKQPNQCNQCKDQNLSYKLFTNTIIFLAHILPDVHNYTRPSTKLLGWVGGKFWRVNRMVVGARMSGPRESDGHVTVSCDLVHSTKQPANPQVAHKFPPIRSQIEVKL